MQVENSELCFWCLHLKNVNKLNYTFFFFPNKLLIHPTFAPLTVGRYGYNNQSFTLIHRTSSTYKYLASALSNHLCRKKFRGKHENVRFQTIFAKYTQQTLGRRFPCFGELKLANRWVDSLHFLVVLGCIFLENFAAKGIFSLPNRLIISWSFHCTMHCHCILSKGLRNRYNNRCAISIAFA